jgi:hypothetical protein
MRQTTVFMSTLALTAGVAGADIVQPGIDLAFNGGFSSLSREADRVLQQFIDSTLLTDITVPVEILGVSFRLPASAGDDYPALGDLNFGVYDITLAKPSAAVAGADGLTSATFADNMVDPILVRSGALNIPLGSFESNDANVDADFSFEIVFDTPYSYTPGDDLVILVRHDGHGDANGRETRWNFDAFAWPNGTVVSTIDVNDAIGNFGPGTFNTVNKYQFTITPEPGSAALLGLAGVLFAGRRR